MSTLRALAVQHEDDARRVCSPEWAGSATWRSKSCDPTGARSCPTRSTDWHSWPSWERPCRSPIATVPWLDAELQWIARADALAVPVLGICLRRPGPGRRTGRCGASGTGARAGPGDGAGLRADEARWRWRPTGFAWHEDAIGVCGSARLLARNEAGVQAFLARSSRGRAVSPSRSPRDITTRWIEQARSDYPRTRISPLLWAESASVAVAAARRATSVRRLRRPRREPRRV